MPIDFENDELIGFKERYKLPGPPPTHDQMNYWINTGIKVKGVEGRVKLESIKHGGRVYTTRAAYVHFLKRTNHNTEGLVINEDVDAAQPEPARGVSDRAAARR